jgi:hypothetical protein
MKRLFDEAYCNKKYIIIFRNYEFGSSITGSDELIIDISDELVSFSDINDMSLKIKRCCISNIDLSENEISKEIRVGFGNNNITFMICE